MPARRWGFVLADDGIGVDLATVQYQVRDADADTVLLAWTAAPVNLPGGPGAYEPRLYRRTATVPAVAALGRDGRFEIALRGRDRLGREVSAARCWNHRVLAAPLLFDPATVATSSPLASGKVALRALSLANPPGGPIGAYVLSNTSPGTGLMEYVVWNPATEPVYLTIDLTLPAPAASTTYSKTYTRNRWTFSDLAANNACGSSTLPGPDTDLPGCNPAITNPGPGDTTLISASGSANPAGASGSGKSSRRPASSS